MIVEARTLHESAARGMELLCNSGGVISSVDVIVHEPGKRFKVEPHQITQWLRTRAESDTIGIAALKRRVLALIDGEVT